MENPNTPEEEELDELNALVQDYADAVNRGDAEEQQAASLRMLQHASRTQGDASPWLQAMTEAHHCEAEFDWIGAEQAYKRAVEVSVDQPASQYRAYNQLSALYDLVGLDALALEAEQASTQAARLSSFSVLLHKGLVFEAKSHLKAKNVEGALNSVAEAFAGINDEPMHDLQRARVLILRADCFLAQGELDKAEADLTSAWVLLEPHSQAFFSAGWQSGLASYWAVAARLRVQHGDLSGAVLARREAVERRRIIAQCPQLEGPYKFNWLAAVLRDLAKSLREAGENGAEEACEESDSIRRSIGLAPLER